MQCIDLMNSKMQIYEKALIECELTDELSKINDIHEEAGLKLNELKMSGGPTDSQVEDKMRHNTVQYLSFMDEAYFKAVMGYWKEIYLNDLTKHGFEHDIGLDEIHNLAIGRIEAVTRRVMLGDDLAYDNGAVQSLVDGYLIELWKLRAEVRLPRFYFVVVSNSPFAYWRSICRHFNPGSAPV